MIADKIDVNNLERGFVEHLEDPNSPTSGGYQAKKEIIRQGGGHKLFPLECRQSVEKIRHPNVTNTLSIKKSSILIMSVSENFLFELE